MEEMGGGREKTRRRETREVSYSLILRALIILIIRMLVISTSIGRYSKIFLLVTRLVS